jgi:hypothetical protein
MLRRGSGDERVREPARVDEAPSLREEVRLHVEEEPVRESERSAGAGDGNNPQYEACDADNREV